MDGGLRRTNHEPLTEDILKEIDHPGGDVFVLPNNKNIIMAAAKCVPAFCDK